MDIQFYGANCLVLSDKNTRIVIDDTLEAMGGKSVTRPGDICLFTAAHPDKVEGAKITIDIAGEYEVNGVSIHGLQARAHTDEEKDRNATMYKIVLGEEKILVTGHVFPKFSETKLEDIGLVDIMCVPAGGNGYTVDPVGALQLVKQVEPKIVVLTHYDDASLKFPVPQQTFEDVLKAFGVEPKETTKKLQFKPADTTDSTQLVVLEKS